MQNANWKISSIFEDGLDKGFYNISFCRLKVSKVLPSTTPFSWT